MIPEKVKVGGLFYDVIVTDEPLILNNRECKGLINYDHQVIKLAGDSVQSDQSRMQTFCHELVHAFTHSRNIEWDDKDELYTDEIGIALHAFLVDNNIKISGGS